MSGGEHQCDGLQDMLNSRIDDERTRWFCCLLLPLNAGLDFTDEKHVLQHKSNGSQRDSRFEEQPQVH